LTRLSRIIAESLGEAERKAFLEKMFQLARADNIFEMLEENYLRIITSALMLSHKDFIQAKLKTA
jgi:uncharacterized tellurite resistance protein B-like protein